MSKNIVKVWVVVLVMSFFVGCGQEATVNKSVQNIKKSSQPKWISNPNTDGYIGVVSVIPKKKIKNEKKLYHIAKLKAQAAFQARKSTNIDSSSQIRTKSDGSVDYKEKVKLSSSHIQTNNLVVKDTFEDKDNFYMWMIAK